MVGLLAAATGRSAEAAEWFDHVLATRAPGPWTSLTRLDRAATPGLADPEASVRDADRAATELDGFAMPAWVAEARALGQRLRLSGHGDPIARRVGATWTLRHPAGRAVVAASRGMDHLVQLLGRPGETFPVTVLDTRVDPALPDAAATEETLDARARAAYRRRLRELDALDELGPEQRAEGDFLRRELAGAAYVASSKEIERARVRVTKAIRRALLSVADADPSLGAHLETSVQTGRVCLYAPADGRAWTIVAADDPMASHPVE